MKNKGLRSISFLVLFAIAMYFERASITRFVLLVGLGSILLIMPYVRSHKYPSLFMVDIGVLIALNMNSKYVVSPIFMLLFGYVLLDMMLLLKKPFHVMYGSFALLALAFVLSRRFVYELHYQAVTEVLFTILVFVVFSILLYYVRSYREAKDELEVANEQMMNHYTALRHSEQALRVAKEEVERLARVEERAALARNLHDTVGHELTGLIMSIEMLKLKPEASEVKEALTETAKQTREILSTLRKSVSESVAEDDVFYRLSEAIDKFKKQTGVNVHCHFEMSFDKLSKAVAMCAYRTFLESLTNTAKHSNAKDVWLSIQWLSDKEILIKCIDNGKTDGDFNVGHGLKFMKERVWALGGEIDFQKDKAGFSCVVKLPIG